MSTRPRSHKRRFVSASARQQRLPGAKTANTSPVGAAALRGCDDGATRWPTALGAPRISTDRDDLCAAYYRSAAGFDLLVDHLVRTEDHLLIVVAEGDLVLESAGQSFAVRKGSSVVVAPGLWRVTEVSASGQVGYWLVFYGLALLVEAIGDDEQASQLASRVTPAYRNVFVQPRLLDLLHTWGQPGPASDVVQTVRALATTMSASFYMYLREHYYSPRRVLQGEVRLRWMEGFRKIGRSWAGGPRAFRREFRLYHGTSLRGWLTRWNHERSRSSRRGSASRADCSEWRGHETV